MQFWTRPWKDLGYRPAPASKGRDFRVMDVDEFMDVVDRVLHSGVCVWGGGCLGACGCVGVSGGGGVWEGVALVLSARWR
jgi:hypothetical protein